METLCCLRMLESKPTGGIQKATPEEKTDVRVGGPLKLASQNLCVTDLPVSQNQSQNPWECL